MKEINIQFYYKISGQNSYISPLESETLFSIMRKSLLLVVLLMVSAMSTIYAQESLFKAPDTVCVRQDVQLMSNVPDKQSHYWGFCSGYLYNNPTGVNLGDNFEFDGPSDIDVVRNDDGNYYGFVLNAGNNTLIRLDYGTDLSSVPTVTSFGDVDGLFPIEANSMHLVRDLADSNWYMFVTSGASAPNSALSRIDFGKSLANTPAFVSFGNLENKLAYPDGIFVGKEDGKWYAFITNKLTNEIIRCDMGDNISLTPTLTTLNIPTSDLSAPTDIGALLDNGKWYFFVTNAASGGSGTGYILRVDMGSLSNLSPPNILISNTIPDLSNPSAITLIRDCGRIHGFITNQFSHDIVRLEMETIEGPYTGTDFANLGPGQTLSPTGISRVVRDRDNVYAFITNQANGTLTRMGFEQCDNTNIPFSTTKTPPAYRYDTPGLYNIYYAVNEGLPDMQVQCKQIRALKIPALILLPPDTTICLGDTANLRVISINAISYTWTPNYNISDPSNSEIRVYPEYSTKYNVRMPFPLGSCVVDTSIQVNVIKVEADAGPNRTIADGATTLLGGPNTSQERYLLKRWTPNQYIDDIYADNPTVRPPHDFTYYLTVVDSGTQYQCFAVDTVQIIVGCENVNLPNAFTPERAGPRAKFGILNTQIVKLDRFNIFDRWGKLVFSTTDPTNQWDGNIGSEKAAVGVYVWEVDGFCSSGRRLQATGNVMLIR